MQSLCPTVLKVLSLMVQLDLDREKNTPPLALIYGIVMFKRFHELSRLQRLNTVLLSDGNASKEISLLLKWVIISVTEKNYEGIMRLLFKLDDFKHCIKCFLRYMLDGDFVPA